MRSRRAELLLSERLRLQCPILVFRFSLLETHSIQQLRFHSRLLTEGKQDKLQAFTCARQVTALGSHLAQLHVIEGRVFVACVPHLENLPIAEKRVPLHSDAYLAVAAPRI